MLNKKKIAALALFTAVSSPALAGNENGSEAKDVYHPKTIEPHWSKVQAEDGASQNSRMPVFEGVETVPVNVHWDDVISLDIKDPELKRVVSNFLDYFQGAKFGYQKMDPQTRQISMNYLSGQDLLSEISELKETYKSAGIDAWLKSQGHDLFENGRFVISSTDEKYKGDVQSGSNTMFIGIPGSEMRLPVRIHLSEAYLKGAKMPCVDGKKHPVSVEGVLVNEIAHLAKASQDERMSNEIEAIVSVPMGAVQRDVSRHDISYFPNQNGGYVSLMDKAIEVQKLQPVEMTSEQKAPEPEPELLKQTSVCCDDVQSAGYSCVEASDSDFTREITPLVFKWTSCPSDFPQPAILNEFSGNTPMDIEPIPQLSAEEVPKYNIERACDSLLSVDGPYTMVSRTYEGCAAKLIEGRSDEKGLLDHCKRLADDFKGTTLKVRAYEETSPVSESSQERIVTAVSCHISPA